jgi:hypothetical protein
MVKRDVFKSGETALVAGTFVALNHAPNHPQQVELKKGEEFPLCPSCKQTVKYRLAAK